jgi:hypothetical protein
MCNGFRTAKVQHFSLTEKYLPIYFKDLVILNPRIVYLEGKGELAAVYVAQ